VHRWFAEERSPALLNWDTGEGKSYWIPALEITGFVFSLNQVNRHLLGARTNDTDFDSFERNLKTGPSTKGPVQRQPDRPSLPGGIYYGFARSAGLQYWNRCSTRCRQLSLGDVRETTPPSINDYVSTTIGGSFVGEALFRMRGLLLEGGGERPGFWRELGAR